LDDRAHDGEGRVNNTHGDRSEKNCLDLAVIETRHRSCGENNEKHQEGDANRLDVEPNAHRTIDQKPHDQGQDQRKSQAVRSPAASLAGPSARQQPSEDQRGSNDHLGRINRPFRRCTPRDRCAE